MNINREIKHILGLMEPNLLALLEENHCIIAGGALTSAFTNKEVNDIDVYFRDGKSFSSVMLEILETKENISYNEAVVSHYTDKSILLNSNGQKVQLIAYRFFPTVDDIFADFDFTINMAAIELHPDGKEAAVFTAHQQFLKHCSQRYLEFHVGTRYPLVSALRTQKYKERGYFISKAQMLRILLAVNMKNIDSWEVLLDELGSMYGLKPDEIFDTTQPFSLALALEQLSAIDTIPEKMYNSQAVSWEIIYKQFEGKWDADIVDWMINGKNKQDGSSWYIPEYMDYYDYIEKRNANKDKYAVKSFFGVDVHIDKKELL